MNGFILSDFRELFLATLIFGLLITLIAYCFDMLDLFKYFRTFKQKRRIVKKAQQEKINSLEAHLVD